MQLADGTLVKIMVQGMELQELQRLQPCCKDDARIEVPVGCVLVRYSWFPGKGPGLTFFVRPENAAALLAATNTPSSSIPRRHQL